MCRVIAGIAASRHDAQQSKKFSAMQYLHFGRFLIRMYGGMDERVLRHFCTSKCLVDVKPTRNEVKNYLQMMCSKKHFKETYDMEAAGSSINMALNSLSHEY